MNNDNYALGNQFDSPARKVDRVCKRFEEAWASKERPSIEDFLPSVDSEERLIYLRALIEVDIDFRRRIGERVDLEDYSIYSPAGSIFQGSLFDQSRQERNPADLSSAISVARATALTHGDLIRLLNDWIVREMAEDLPDFEMLELIGWGGMGQVVRARNRATGLEYALKTIQSEFLDDSERMRLFDREFEVMNKLDHPNIPRAISFMSSNGRPVIAIEHISGIDLSRYAKKIYITKHKNIPIWRACKFVRQGAEALAYSHRMGIVHRDVKPANFMLNRKGKVWLIDFGLSEARKRRKTPLDSKKYVMGTPDYIAPEQVTNFHTADGRADTYSLGCTLYLLLTGRPPFAGLTSREKLYSHRNRVPRAIEELRDDIPGDVIIILQKMMMKNPDERFQDAMEIAEALEPYCAIEKRKIQFSYPTMTFEEVFALPIQIAEAQHEVPRPQELLIGVKPTQQRVFNNADKKERHHNVLFVNSEPIIPVSLFVRFISFIAYAFMLFLIVFFVRILYFSPKESTRVPVAKTPLYPRSNMGPRSDPDIFNERNARTRERLGISDDTLGMIIPLYRYPIAENNALWDRVLALGDRGVRLIAVIGPNLDDILQGDTAAYRELIKKLKKRNFRIADSITSRLTLGIV